MKDILIIIGVFILGIILGITHIIPTNFEVDAAAEWMLYALLLFVGIGIGSDKESLSAIKRMRGWLIFLPFVIVCGSLLMSLLSMLIYPQLKTSEVLAVSSGMGYYSLSSILITQLHGENLGTVALLSNLIREVFTLLFTPFLIQYFGKLTPIASGGATAMDTTLAVVVRFSGKDYVMIAIYCGVVITFLVPFMVSFFLS